MIPVAEFSKSFTLALDPGFILFADLHREP
jgi:hypothetical protein